MIKRTLYIDFATHLHTRLEQLVFERVGGDGEVVKESRPIEDIGTLIIDHYDISLTQKLLSVLNKYNVSLIVCDDKRMPSGLLLPLESNTLQSQRFRAQIGVSEPLKKNLWQQTVIAKIGNQAALLKKRGIAAYKQLEDLCGEVVSGDVTNIEAKAAAYYWQNLFFKMPDFKRGREERAPNNLFNYGYSLLRASVARGLVGAGLLPTLGIHHTNKYNAFCLADDIMEPYRPFVDGLVCELVDGRSVEDYEIMQKGHKAHLLKINGIDVDMMNEKSPLMVGVQKTSRSLVGCFENKTRKIIYPRFV